MKCGGRTPRTAPPPSIGVEGPDLLSNATIFPQLFPQTEAGASSDRSVLLPLPLGEGQGEGLQGPLAMWPTQSFKRQAPKWTAQAPVQPVLSSQPRTRAWRTE
jgi:hypothetical protein